MNIKKAVSGCRLACAATLALASLSCGDMAREGKASSYLIIEALLASAGETDDFVGELRSDVRTGGGILNDNGEVAFALGMKDPSNPTGPTTANFITVNRYRVVYIRADGRSTPG